MTMFVTTQEAYKDYLMHYGVLGMHWGVRRYQNKDGTLTSAGKKRYSDNSPVKDSDKKDKASKSDNLSDDERIARANKKRIAKIIGISAGVALTAATAYVVKKQLDYRYGGMIDSDTPLRNINIRDDPSALNDDRAYYFSYKNADNKKYAGFYANTLRARAGDKKSVNQSLYSLSNGGKIASRKEAEDVFLDLYKNNKEFRRNYDVYAQTYKEFANNPFDRRRELYKKAYSAKTDKDLRKYAYGAFNVQLADHRIPESNTMHNIFYKTLKDKGFSAIVDLNDQKYGGYNSKKPIIIFDTDKLSLTSNKILSSEEITNNFRNETFKKIGKDTSLSFGKVALAGYASMKLSRISRDSAAIKQYKQEHPNTKMTDEEILDSLKKGDQK